MCIRDRYSDEVKPNLLSYGEKSDVVLEAQKRLKLLGYMTTEPDGTYGNDTIMAVKQFQSRNDQVVDGFLGPDTRIALNSDSAVPNGISLGDSGESVQSCLLYTSNGLPAGKLIGVQPKDTVAKLVKEA